MSVCECVRIISHGVCKHMHENKDTDSYSPITFSAQKKITQKIHYPHSVLSLLLFRLQQILAISSYQYTALLHSLLQLRCISLNGCATLYLAGPLD